MILQIKVVKNECALRNQEIDDLKCWVNTCLTETSQLMQKKVTVFFSFYDNFVSKLNHTNKHIYKRIRINIIT